ncbi:MAG: dihydroneopterin aldolase [Thalassovita sp.]
MSNETTWAFAHPSERSEGTAASGPLDRISVRNHIVDVEIGAFQAERGVTQRISFNVVVEVRPLEGPVDDDVDRILSYDKVTDAITFELAAERLNLLETLADRIAARILIEPQAERVFVRIEKLDRGPGALGVEIVRAQVPQSAVLTEEEKQQPKVVYLSNEAIRSDLLLGWLDQLQDDPRPTILCVGAPEQAAPQACHPLAQRRIDLLAAEQNAWVLAARDARCVVVNTRTELDWAMKNDQISVWAPSKIVLDAVEELSSLPTGSVELAMWFAKELEAGDIWVVGAPLPQGASASARSVDVTTATL